MGAFTERVKKKFNKIAADVCDKDIAGIRLNLLERLVKRGYIKLERRPDSIYGEEVAPSVREAYEKANKIFNYDVCGMHLAEIPAILEPALEKGSYYKEPYFLIGRYYLRCEDYQTALLYLQEAKKVLLWMTVEKNPKALDRELDELIAETCAREMRS